VEQRQILLLFLPPRQRDYRTEDPILTEIAGGRDGGRHIWVMRSAQPICLQRVTPALPRQVYKTKKERARLYTYPISCLDAVRICLTHPDRRKTPRLSETDFMLVRDLATQSPTPGLFRRHQPRSGAATRKDIYFRLLPFLSNLRKSA
jgi:hypothetical protein